ncbi:acyltransferase family protein [Actinophytocola sp. KF-1]
MDLSTTDGSRAATRPSRLPTLTGMRFIAAAMVFFFHANQEALFSSPDAGGVFNALASQGGWTGVGFFFILSGFVLTWSARSGDSAPRFWRRRFFKIYPNHFVTFIAAFLLLTVVAQETIENWRAILNLFLLQSWFPAMETSLTLNTVSWSLSVELLFYLSFPLLLRVISRIRPERLWYWAGGVVAVILVVPVVASAMPPSEPFLPWANATPTEFWFVYLLPPVRMLEFVFGMILARIVLTGRKIPLGLGGAVALTVLAYFLAPMFPGTYPIVGVMVLPLGLLIAAGAVADVQGHRTVLSTRTLVWLGEVSFAFYLWHRLVLVYGHQWIAGVDDPTSYPVANAGYSTPVGLALLVLLFGVNLLLAWATFALVEKPVMRRFARSRRRPHPVAETPVAEAPRRVPSAEEPVA